MCSEISLLMWLTNPVLKDIVGILTFILVMVHSYNPYFRYDFYNHFYMVCRFLIQLLKINISSQINAVTLVHFPYLWAGAGRCCSWTIWFPLLGWISLLPLRSLYRPRRQFSDQVVTFSRMDNRLVGCATKTSFFNIIWKLEVIEMTWSVNLDCNYTFFSKQ